ncbi:MAG: SDR family NAD(P)-dependent oxidoreductase [Bacteroidetes bacterium]|nr:SDR family NAD(P)-dependent oxidoreductase [Bacteroidota bacterium]
MHNPFSLEGKKILVTGASSGIGAQTAICVSQMGATLIITGRNEENLKKILKQLHGEGHQAIVADLCDDIEPLINSCQLLDGIVNCAGITKHLPIKFIDRKAIDQIFDINYTGPVILINRLFKLKKINPGASIVLLSSLASMFPFKGGTLYSGAKAAIDIFSKTIAIEFSSQKIRANTVNAGMVKTPLLNSAEETISKEAMQTHEKAYPLGFGETTDIANMCVFLLSDASRWITGTNIVMDGGLTAGT